MRISLSAKSIVTGYMLISILYFFYNMLQLPKLPYFAIRFLLMLVVVFYVIRIIKCNINKSKNLALFLCYCLYLVFTFVFIFLNNYPIALIPEAIMEGIFPMLFFFVALDEKQKPLCEVKFYNYYFIGSIILFVCSIYLFVTLPSWYIDWKRSMLPESLQDEILIMGAMSGPASTGYLVGYVAYFSFCFLLFKFYYKETKKYEIILLYIVGFCLLFSQVRVALLTAAVVLLWYLKKTLSPRSFMILAAIMICFGLLFIYIVNQSEFLSAMLDTIAYKLDQTSDGSRFNTGFVLLSKQSNYIFGHGYGSGGNVANGMGLPSVTDAEYFKLFYETGIIGFCFFIVLVIKTLLRIKANKRIYMFEFFIIFFYLVAMLVADPLSLSAMMSNVFWYAIGRVLL